MKEIPFTDVNSLWLDTGISFRGQIRRAYVRESDPTRVTRFCAFPEDMKFWRVKEEHATFEELGIDIERGTLVVASPIAYDEVDIHLVAPERPTDYLVSVRFRVYAVFVWFHTDQTPDRLYWCLARPIEVVKVLTINNRQTEPPVLVNIHGVTGNAKTVVEDRYLYREIAPMFKRILHKKQLDIMMRTRTRQTHLHLRMLHQYIPHGIGFFEMSGVNLDWSDDYSRNFQLVKPVDDPEERKIVSFPSMVKITLERVQRREFIRPERRDVEF